VSLVPLLDWSAVEPMPIKVVAAAMPVEKIEKAWA
jgi:hypothetical protein